MSSREVRCDVRRKATWAMLLVLAPSMLWAAETRVGPRGQVIVDGKPIIPLGVWSQPPYMFDYHRQLGMNCMIGAHTDRGDFRDGWTDIFVPAEKNGLGLVTHYNRRSAGQKQVWGWLSGLLIPPNLDRPKRSFERIRGEDTTHLVMTHIDAHLFLDGREPDFYRQGLRYADAVITHVWPEIDGLDKRNLRNVGTFIDLVREYTKDRPDGEISIWPDINPHLWHRKNREGGTHYDAPTRAELRFQIWLALIHGADGLCFFPISFDPFVYSQIPAQNEQELAWNTRLIERMTPALTSEESPLAIRVRSERDGGILDVTTRAIDGRHYVFLVNGEGDAQTVTLEVPGLGSQWQLRDVVRERPLAVAGGEFSERVDGLALRIWELAPPDKQGSAESANPKE